MGDRVFSIDEPMRSMKVRGGESVRGPVGWNGLSVTSSTPTARRSPYLPLLTLTESHQSINPLSQAAKQAVCEMALKEVAPQQYARYFPPPSEDEEEGEDDEDEREQYIDGACAHATMHGRVGCEVEFRF